LQATIDQMKNEMRWTIQGYDATIDRITKSMGGAVPSSTPAAESHVTPTGRFNPATGKVEPIQ
jgi:hypothetical protein